MTANRTGTPDNDRFKGAVEPEDQSDRGQTSLSGQLGHRENDPLIKSSDTDFPEPGENPEHSGEVTTETSSDEDAA